MRALPTGSRLIELIAAVLMLAASVYLYRRRDKSDSYGSQGAVILLVVAGIMALHALGALDYHPTTAEAEFLRSRR